MEITKDMALKELAIRELKSRGEFSSESSVKADPMKTYKNENIGDVYNNIFVRPGAGVRNTIRGGSFMEGFDDPNSVPSFQSEILGNYYNSGFLEGHNTLKTLLGNVPSAVGLAGDIATNPADSLLMLLGKAPVKGTGTTLDAIIADSKLGQTVGRMANAEINKPSDLAKLVNPRLTETPGALERLQSARAGAESRKTVSKLLPSADLATDIKQNRASGVQVEGSNLIKKTNDPQSIVNKFRLEKERVLNTVDDLVAENNMPVDPNFVGTRAKLILEKDLKNATPKERADIMKWVKEEGNWIDEQDGFDTVKANARKRYLYQETQGMQKKQNSGKVTVTSPERDKVRDAFSQAYKEAIERTHPDIQKLNSRFSGLDAGETAAAKLTESAIENQPNNIIQRAIGYTVGRLTPGQGVAAAVREVPSLVGSGAKSISGMTGKIEKLSSTSADLLAKSRELQGERLLNTFLKDKPNQQFFRELLTHDDLVSVTNPQFQKSIGVSDKFGDGFERTNPEEAYNRIKDFALKYWNPKTKIVDIPSGEVFSTKSKTLLKSFGIDPVTGKVTDKVKSALEVAMKRKG